MRALRLAPLAPFAAARSGHRLLGRCVSARLREKTQETEYEVGGGNSFETSRLNPAVKLQIVCTACACLIVFVAPPMIKERDHLLEGMDA